MNQITEESRIKTLNTLRNKSLQLFLKKGFDGVSITEIAKESGMTKPTFYNYLQSKEDLLLFCFQSDPTRLENLERTVTERGAWASGIIEYFCYLHQLFSQYGNGLFGQLVKTGLNHPNDPFGLNEVTQEKILKWIALARCDGQITPSLSDQELLQVILAYFYGFCFYQCHHDEDNVTEQLERHLSILLNVVDPV